MKTLLIVSSIIGLLIGLWFLGASNGVLGHDIENYLGVDVTITKVGDGYVEFTRDDNGKTLCLYENGFLKDVTVSECNQ